MYLQHTALPYEIFIMIDYIWKKFWRLLIVEDWGKNTQWRKKVLCRCDCWNTKEILLYCIGKSINSCWCLRKERIKISNTKHWFTKHWLYDTRRNMIRRCTINKYKRYNNYWWRWIKVCKERIWINWFENFCNDMWDKKEWMSLDRIDNNWDYCKDNCRRATRTEQQKNRRCSIIYMNKTTLERSKELSVNYNTMRVLVWKIWLQKTIEHYTKKF